MNDWDFSLFQLIPLLLLLGILVVILNFIKQKTIRQLIKIAVVIMLLYSVFTVVAFKINADRKEDYLNSIG